MSHINPCRCRTGWFWCWLDWVTICQIRPICDRHDRTIRGEQ